MAADDYDPTTGAPIFAGTGAPDTGVDLTLLGAFAAGVGTRPIGTTAERIAYGYSREGLAWWDTDLNALLVHDGTNWVRQRRSAKGTVAIPSAGGSSTTPVFYTSAIEIMFPAGLFTAVPQVMVAYEGAGVGWSDLAAAPTTDGATLRAYRINAAPAGTLRWRAEQD